MSVKDEVQNSMGDIFNTNKDIVEKHENIISKVQSKNESEINQALSKLEKMDFTQWRNQLRARGALCPPPG